LALLRRNKPTPKLNTAIRTILYVGIAVIIISFLTHIIQVVYDVRFLRSEIRDLGKLMFIFKSILSLLLYSLPAILMFKVIKMNKTL
jgi:hypothetical protein